jgi:hypothetical protein
LWQHERDEKYCITRNLIGKREGELSVDGRMILAWIVEKQDVRVWNGSIKPQNF